jgi:hypothetical protein
MRIFSPARSAERIQFSIEPASHLHAGVAGGERHQVVGRVQLAPQLDATAELQPAVHLLRIHAERHGGKEGGGLALAFPVIRGRMPHLGGAATHRVEHFERRHQLAAAIHLHREPTTAAARDQFRQLGCARTEPGKVRRPGRHHLPLARRGVGGLVALRAGRGGLAASRQPARDRGCARTDQPVSTLHSRLP